MDYNTSWQHILSTINGTGITSFSHPAHFNNIATSSPTCRSIWWRLLLGVLPRDTTKWLNVLRQQRCNYDELRLRFSVTPGITEDFEDLSLNNPLSQDTQSSWNQYFEDSELKRVIRQDVVRTFPDERFFHTPLIQETMVAILFCYAREHVDVGFKQGQHEILAPILLTLHIDHQDYEQARKSGDLQSIIREVMDPAYMEHDAYFLLCGVMSRLSQWYHNKEDPPPPALQQPPQLVQLLHAQPFDSLQSLDSEPLKSLPPLAARIHRLHAVLLPAHFPALAQHLAALDVPPQVYEIRWLRLLFGREFTLPDVALVWDALFWCCTPDDLPLVDYVALALLSTVHDTLLASDYLGCLNLLMRFPPPKDTVALLNTALRWYSQRQKIASHRLRHNSSEEILEKTFQLSRPPSLSPLHGYSSLPPTRPVPSALPHLNVTANAPTNVYDSVRSGNGNHHGSSNSNNSNMSSSSVSSSSSRTRTSSETSLSNGVWSGNSVTTTLGFGAAERTPEMQRGQSVQGPGPHGGGGVVRSRSQVTRCSSEGGMRGGRQPSASPRRNNTDHVVSYSAGRDAVTADTPTSHKSSLLNFVKFGTVKFNNRRDEEVAQERDVNRASYGIGGRLLEDMSHTGRQETTTGTRGGFVTRQVCDTLQRLAGELTGHLAALSHRHQQLGLTKDLSVRVTMDSLSQVSHALQEVADLCDQHQGHVASPSSPTTSFSSQLTLGSEDHAGAIHHPLEHPLATSPD